MTIQGYLTFLILHFVSLKEERREIADRVPANDCVRDSNGRETASYILLMKRSRSLLHYYITRSVRSCVEDNRQWGRHIDRQLIAVFFYRAVA